MRVESSLQQDSDGYCASFAALTEYSTSSGVAASMSEPVSAHHTCLLAFFPCSRFSKHAARGSR